MVVVDPATGQPWVEVVDLRVEGRPDALVLARRWVADGWEWRGVARLLVEDHGVRVLRPFGEELPGFPPTYPNPMEPYCIAGSELENGHGDLLRCTEQGYELLLSTGQLERYSAEGQLTERDLGPGGRLLVSWSQDGLTGLETADGRTITLDETRVVGSRRERRAWGPSGDRVLYQYDDQDRLVSVTTAGGLQHRYLYDSQDRLEAILWSDGSRAVLRWDNQGRVQGIDGPGRSRWRYEWGDDGLTRATDGSGGSWSVQRSRDGVSVRDPAGRSAKLLVDDGRIAGWQDPAGYKTHIDRDTKGRLEALRAPNGARWSMETDELQRLTRLTGPLGSPWRLAWDDDAGRLTISDPAGRVRSYRTDTAGRVVEINEGASTTALHRDDAGRVLEIVHGTQGSTRIARDASGRIQTITDAAGGRTRLSDWVGAMPGAIEDPEGGTWKLLFDRLSRVRALSTPDGAFVDWVRDPSGDLAILQRDQARTRLDRRTDGAITRVTDPLGRLTGWTRDAVGRVTAWLRPDGSELRISRDARGDTQRLTLGEQGLQVERDMQGRPIALTQQGANGGPLLAWARDMAGQVRSITWPQGSLELERDGAGMVRTVTLGERIWKLSRGPTGRLREVTEGDLDWVIRRDDSGQITGLDAPATTMDLQRDPRGNTRQAELFGLSVHWRRDAVGRAARIEGPGGAALGIQRDEAGHPVLFRLPGGPLLRAAHSTTERQLRLEDASGNILYQASGHYDALGRLETVTDASGALRHRYGPSDELQSIEGDSGAWSVFPGRREGPPGTLEITTDERGRPIHAAISLAAPAWGVARRQLEYLIDDAGDLGAVLGDAGQAELEHDELGRLLSVTIREEAGQPPLATWRVDWDPFGRPEAIRSQDGDTLLCFHDGRLLGIQERGHAAVLMGDDAVTVLAGEAGHTTLVTGIGGYKELALFAQGEPYIAASTPGGLRDLGHPGLLADGGRLLLFPGGPSLGPQDARDPLSGLPTSARGSIFPWQAQGWPSPDEHTAWPVLDGSSVTPWDPAPWDHEGPWSDPLGLLVGLGELSQPLTDDWWSAGTPAAPLPWMPASIEGAPPAILPPTGAMPLDESLIAATLLAAAMPPARALDSASLLQVLLADELEGVPRGWPGIVAPSNIPSSR